MKHLKRLFTTTWMTPQGSVFQASFTSQSRSRAFQHAEELGIFAGIENNSVISISDLGPASVDVEVSEIRIIDTLENIPGPGGIQ